MRDILGVSSAILILIVIVAIYAVGFIACGIIMQNIWWIGCLMTGLLMMSAIKFIMLIINDFFGLTLLIDKSTKK